jgi:hypothetical protein
MGFSMYGVSLPFVAQSLPVCIEILEECITQSTSSRISIREKLLPRPASLYCIDASRPLLKEFTLLPVCSNKYIFLGAEGRADNIG